MAKSGILQLLSANVSRKDEELGAKADDAPEKSGEDMNPPQENFFARALPQQLKSWKAQFSPPWKSASHEDGQLSDPNSTADALSDAPDESKELAETAKLKKKLKPFKRGLPPIDIDESMEKVLAEKGVWRSQQYGTDVAIARGVMDVKASPQVVWNQLFDFSTYVGKVPVFCTADVYKRYVQSASQSEQPKESKASSSNWMQAPVNFFNKVIGDHPEPGILWLFGKVVGAGRPEITSAEEEDRDGTGSVVSPDEVERIFVKYQSQVIPGIRLTCYCDHTYEPAKSSVTWECDDDYSKQNSVDEVQGHWHVSPHPDGSTKSRVFYEIALLLPKFIPRWIIDQLSKNVVKEATQWVKTQSELAAVRAPPLKPEAPPVKPKAPPVKPKAPPVKPEAQIPKNETANDDPPGQKEKEIPSLEPEADAPLQPEAEGTDKLEAESDSER